MASKPAPFLALLRGINVGGKNVISKEALKKSFEDVGFENVRTYIQSGNILFQSDTANIKEMTEAIEDILTKKLSNPIKAVVLSRRKYKSSVNASPKGWGEDDQFKHNAMFTIGSVTPKKILAQLPEPKAKIEFVGTAPGVIFWSASRKQIAKTTVMKLGASPAYKQVTVRNHNTVFKLLKMFDEMLESS